MGIKALFTYDYGKDNMKKIQELGYDIKIIHEKQITYTKELEDTEVLVCYNPFNNLDISLMKNLKWIQLSSAGIDQLPIDKIRNGNIKVTNNNGSYSIPIGEWIVLKTLELFKNSKKFYEKQQNKIWKLDTDILEIYNRTIGFIGTGSIAKEAAKRFQGFGVKILGINTKGRPVKYFDKCYAKENMNEMLPQCDVVIVTLPYTKETDNFVNKEVFNYMKNDIVFINISRGNIVDQEELINNIKARKIKSAALDVFNEEPLTPDNYIWSLDNVIITPHNSWLSDRRNERRFEIIYKNMKRYVEQKDLIGVIDINKGY
ncbi:phosphoglycerate dehydrogenase [Clostridium niameyense]|uniref:phosphoglycerate dehydrogenase n=1 Tax=Clostridium niameyense TaxID=1622073 RepID=UPI00067E93D0|nr:phosphoglycerate dehydrogenase [Clostridium niameyense]